MKHLSLFTSIFLILLVSCNRALDGVYVSPGVGITFPSLAPTTPGDLLDYELVTQLSPDQIHSNIPENHEFESEAPGFNLSGRLNYSIAIYRVYYSTTLDGEDIVLSGLAMVPNKSGVLSHYQHHHGTIFPNDPIGKPGLLEAPSLYNGGGPTEKQTQYETRLMMALPASYGYFVSAPDYPGFGISHEVEHPYMVHDELAQSSVDLLRASQELADVLKVSLSQNVVLGGTDEGAGVALAVQKLAEEEYMNEMDVKASIVLGGAYNFERWMDTVITNTNSVGGLSNLNWAIYALNKWSDSPMFITDIWQGAVLDQFDAINISTMRPKEIFTDSFISAYADTATALNAEATANTLLNGWRPIGEILIHSGTQDTKIPFYHAQDGLEVWNELSLNRVRLSEYEATHKASRVLYLRSLLNELNRLD